MGVKSTYNIDRQTAITIILSKLHSLDNDSLGNILENFKESEYRNYSVSDQLDEESSWNTINDLNDFENGN